MPRWKYKVVRWEHIDPDDTEFPYLLDWFGNRGWELCAIFQGRLYFKREIVPTKPTNQATHTQLTILGGLIMPGQITVDTTNETATVQFVDDKGDTNAAAPVGAVVTFTSDNVAVVTVAADPTNPLVANVTPVTEGTANIGATIADASGAPILEPDGVTPFSVAPGAVTVSAGPAGSAQLVLS